MTSATGELIANILVAVAQWERKMIGQRVREGLAQSDKTLGRIQAVHAGSRPAPVLAEVVEVVCDAREQGLSPASIAERLNRYGHESPRGKRWHRTSVGRLMRRLGQEAA